MKKIFSANQEDLVEAKTKPRLDWDKLQALGPVEVMKWEFEAQGLELVAERWDFGNHAPTLEVSTKVDASNAVKTTASWSLSSMTRDFDRIRIPKRRPRRSSNIRFQELS